MLMVEPTINKAVPTYIFHKLPTKNNTMGINSKDNEIICFLRLAGFRSKATPY